MRVRARARVGVRARVRARARVGVGVRVRVRVTVDAVGLFRTFHSPVRHSCAASCAALLLSSAPWGCVCSCTTTVSSGSVTCSVYVASGSGKELIVGSG